MWGLGLGLDMLALGPEMYTCRATFCFSVSEILTSIKLRAYLVSELWNVFIQIHLRVENTEHIDLNCHFAVCDSKIIIHTG